MTKKLLIALFCLSIQLSLWGQVIAKTGENPLLARFWIDTTGNMPIDSVRKQTFDADSTLWKQILHQRDKGMGQETLFICWLKLTIENRKGKEWQPFLSVGNVDNLIFYVYDTAHSLVLCDSAGINGWKKTDTTAFYLYGIPLHFPANGRYEVYVRCQNTLNKRYYARPYTAYWQLGLYEKGEITGLIKNRFLATRHYFGLQLFLLGILLFQFVYILSQYLTNDFRKVYFYYLMYIFVGIIDTCGEILYDFDFIFCPIRIYFSYLFWGNGVLTIPIFYSLFWHHFLKKAKELQVVLAPYMRILSRLCQFSGILMLVQIVLVRCQASYNTYYVIQMSSFMLWFFAASFIPYMMYRHKSLLSEAQKSFMAGVICVLSFSLFAQLNIFEPIEADISLWQKFLHNVLVMIGFFAEIYFLNRAFIIQAKEIELDKIEAIKLQDCELANIEKMSEERKQMENEILGKLQAEIIRAENAAKYLLTKVNAEANPAKALPILQKIETIIKQQSNKAKDMEVALSDKYLNWGDLWLYICSIQIDLAQSQTIQHSITDFLEPLKKVSVTTKQKYHVIKIFRMAIEFAIRFLSFEEINVKVAECYHGQGIIISISIKGQNIDYLLIRQSRALRYIRKEASEIGGVVSLNLVEKGEIRLDITIPNLTQS